MNLQFASLDRYKRIDSDKILQLFPTGWPNGEPLPADLRVPLREVESRVARIKLLIEGPLQFDCYVIVVMQNGQLTSLEFSKPPPASTKGQAIPVVQTVQHLRDVGKTGVDEASGMFGTSLLEKFSWIANHPINVKGRPRSPKEIEGFQASFGTRLPREFVELLAVSNGFSVGRVTIYGIGDVWSVPRQDEPFVVLGNAEGMGDIAIKARVPDEQIYLLNMETEEITPLGESLFHAMEQLVAGKTTTPRMMEV